MRVDKSYVHKADKESRDKLERRKWTRGLYMIEKKIKDKLLLIDNC